MQFKQNRLITMLTLAAVLALLLAGCPAPPAADPHKPVAHNRRRLTGDREKNQANVVDRAQKTSIAS